MLLVFEVAKEQGSCKRTKIVASNFICCSTLVLDSFYCSGSFYAQHLVRSHEMLSGCLPPGVWGGVVLVLLFGLGFFCFLFSQKLQVMVCAPLL